MTWLVESLSCIKSRTDAIMFGTLLQVCAFYFIFISLYYYIIIFMLFLFYFFDNKLGIGLLRPCIERWAIPR